MIKITQLNKIYNNNKKNRKHVLKDINLELPDKGLVTLLGPSGNGKTTLLNLISGLDNQTNGKIEILDKSFAKFDDKKWNVVRNENLGFIFQNYYLHENLTAYDNLYNVLKYFDISQSECDKRINHALKLVGLENYINRTPSTMSGGQKQRISIARALVKGSKIIIADEPTGNLDSDNTFAIMNLLKQVSKDSLVVLVTHEIKIAKFFSDRIIEIKNGEISNDYINNDQNDLDVINNNVIYTEDMHHRSNTKNENLELDIISDKPLGNLALKLIQYNGNLYLDLTNFHKDIKIIDENSELKIVEDTKKSIIKNESSSIDLSPFEVLENKKEKNIFDFIYNYKENRKIYKKTNVKRKLLCKPIYFVLTLMILILGNFCINTYVDTYSSDSNYNCINLSNKTIDIYTDDEKIAEKKKIIEFLDKLNVSLSTKIQMNFYNFDNLQEQNVTNSCDLFLKEKPKNVKVVLGRDIKKDNEFLITTETLKKLKKYKKYTFKNDAELIGAYLKKKDLPIKCVGIVEDKDINIYVNEKTLLKIVERDNEFIYHNKGINSDEYIASYLKSNKVFNYQMDQYQDPLKLSLEQEDQNQSPPPDQFIPDDANVLPIVLLISAVLVIVIAFTVSRMVKISLMQDIKAIGIDRCLGKPKKAFYKKYYMQNIMMLNRSVLLAFVCACLYFIYMYDALNAILKRPSFLLMGGCVVLIYLINLLIVYVEVGKIVDLTPVNIMTKFDL